MSRKIIIKNRQNHEEQLELTLEEFKAKFNIELRQAINTYKAHEESKNKNAQLLKILTKN